jgi:putative copper export protein
MQIMSLVGIFFLGLALVFGIAARKDYLAAGRQLTAAGRTYRRIGAAFVAVGMGLLITSKALPGDP